MTAPVNRSDVPNVLGSHERRIGVLEAVAPPNGSVYQNPEIKYSLFGQEWELFDQNSFTGGGWGGWVADAAAPFGGYYGGQNTQNAYFIVGAAIGPATSRWAFDVWRMGGPDFGILTCEIQTQPLLDSGYANPQQQAILSPSTTDPWYKAAGTGVFNTIDCYAVAPTNSAIYNVSLFAPTGSDGQMLTADGTSHADYTNTSDVVAGGDGSVFWWFRFKVATKNASSTGYKMGVNFLKLRREDTGGFTPW